MKISLILPALIAGLIITTAVNAASYARDVEEISDNVLRLHVIANSDSEADQEVKLKVRDAVLEYSQNQCFTWDNKDDAVDAAASHIPDIEHIANDVLRENGFSYTAHAEIAEVYFPTRTYDKVTLPAGEYTALRIILGEGQGKNWWCVMFPPLCSNAVPSEEAAEYIRKNAGNSAFMMITDADGNVKYELRLKIADFVYEMRHRE